MAPLLRIASQNEANFAGNLAALSNNHADLKHAPYRKGLADLISEGRQHDTTIFHT